MYHLVSPQLMIAIAQRGDLSLDCMSASINLSFIGYQPPSVEDPVQIQLF